MMKFSDRIQLMALKWDSTKEPHKTERFIDDVLHLINQLEGGEWLVFFLDHYLNRAKKNETFSTFMGGSVFDLKQPPRPLVAADPEDQEDEAEGAQPSARHLAECRLTGDPALCSLHDPSTTGISRFSVLCP